MAFFSAGALADAAVSPSLSSATTRFLLALALALAAGAFFGALAGEAFFFAAACRGDARQRVTHEAPQKNPNTQRSRRATTADARRRPCCPSSAPRSRPRHRQQGPVPRHHAARRRSGVNSPDTTRADDAVWKHRAARSRCRRRQPRRRAQVRTSSSSSLLLSQPSSKSLEPPPSLALASELDMVLVRGGREGLPFRTCGQVWLSGWGHVAVPVARVVVPPDRRGRGV